MTVPREEPEVTKEVPPVAKSRISIVIILAMLIGILLAVGSVGAYLHVRQKNELQDELRVFEVALKEKNLALDEMKAQIEALSKQMYLLKEYSIARSSRVSEKNSESAAPAADAAANALKTPGAKENAGLPEVPALASEKAKKPKPETPNCELVGKTPAEQAATLQRCVGLMDSPPGKSRSR